MATKEQAEKNGLVDNNDGTMTNPSTGQKYVYYEGDTTRQLSVKPLGGSSNGYDPYDEKKH